MDSLLELFYQTDEFCQSFLPIWQKQLLNAGEIQRQRQRSLSVSEIMTILIHFHQSHYRHFKAYYTEYVLERLRREFPGLVSYNRFVEFIPCGTRNRHSLQHEERTQSIDGQNPAAQTRNRRNDY